MRNMNISSIQDDEMAVFKNLTRLGFNENHLDLHMLRCFPSVVEIRLQFNSIFDAVISEGDFPNLEVGSTMENFDSNNPRRISICRTIILQVH